MIIVFVIHNFMKIQNVSSVGGLLMYEIINPTEDKKLIRAVQNRAPIYKKDAITSIDSSNPKKIEKEFR